VSAHTGLTAAILATGSPEAACEALERARVVAVLDGWAARQDNSGQVTVYSSEDADSGERLHWCCGLHGRASRGYIGATPDAARAAAAAAIESGEL
jgi:hypothetical protein